MFEGAKTESQENPDTPLPGQSDEDIIADAKAYLLKCQAADNENFKEAMEDLKFLAGDHWPEKQKRQREIDGRPCMTVNKLPTFMNQVTNDQRQNRGGIKVSPVGDNADVDTADVVQGLIKHIEYDSNADFATDTAVAGAAAVGFGYFRIMPEYCDEESFDQKLCFKRIRNGFTVAFDPASMEPDGSDQMRCLIHTKMPKDQFKLEYPDAKVTFDGLQVGLQVGIDNWVTQDWVRTAEFYRIERTPAELCRTSDGATHWKDELPKNLEDVGVTVTATRKSYKKKVLWYKLTALEVLERTEIKCDWIPVFPVYGTELDMDGKVIRSGLIRNARDPQMMYDFWMTSATEEVALRPKTPFIGAKGQFEGFEDDWNQANNKSFPFLEYNPISADGQMAPPPQRQAMADIPQGMLTMAMHANDNIKATTGLFDSSLGAAGTATSGRQEIAQQKQGNISNFHYEDNLTRTRRHAGRCIINMIPHYYDTERVVQIMRDDGEVEAVPINKPLDAEAGQKLQQEQQLQRPSKQEVAIKTVLNDLTVGEYAVVVTTGPSYSTMRKEASEAMVQFGQSWPKLMDIAGDKVVKAMDWPGASEIAERIERTIPPNIRFAPGDPKAGPPPIPPDVEQKMNEMAQQMQELQEENQKLKSGEDRVAIKAHSDEAIAAMKTENAETIARISAEAKRDVEEIKGFVAILVEKLEPPPEVKAAADESMAQD